MKDYRPTSLCNVVARAITNRLKNTLGNIIDPHQSAFILGRSITDDILLGYECMHWLRHSKSRQGYAALKLGMSKTYDRVEWSYLTVILCKMGFRKKWVDLVMNCITLVSYSFNVNSKVIGKVTPTRGLRQGDLLSTYIFVLCTQGLSAILDYNNNRKGLKGIQIASGSPMVTHLFFVDDSLIFFKATKDNMDLVKASLNSYEKVSVQLINFDKSTITFSRNTLQGYIQYIKDTLHL